MKHLSPYEVLQSEVDLIASEVEAPETAKFPDLFLKATAVLSAYGDQNQTRNSVLCAYAIRSLSDDERGAFLSSYELPGRVYQELTSPSAWPIKKSETND